MTLFAFFALWPAALAAGVGAISIPVIIHLINRKRYKIVPWAAMKFLLAAQKQTRKRMRIEQLLLLLVRMLILALIVFAMWSVTDLAEGFWSHLGLANIGKKARTQRIHHVIVLDASLSMNQIAAEGQSAFERARRLAIKKIQDNPSGDGYTVLLLKDSPSWLVGEISQSSAKVIREIEAVRPSHGNSSLSAALNMIAAKLGDGKTRFPAQAVYFFTDMQKTTWMEAAAADHKTVGDEREKNAYLEIDKLAATVFVDVGPPAKDAPGNFAVGSITFDQPFVTSGTEQTLTAAMEYYGAEPKKDVRVEVLLGKAKENANEAPLNLRVVRQETVSFTASSQKMVPFPNFQFPGPGTYVVQVRVSGDTLEQDDARATVITVRKEIPVLVVNGKPHPDRFLQGATFVKLALNPFDTGDEMKQFPLRPRVVTPSEFSGMNDADLKDYDCIFWCDVATFGANDVRKLDAHLRKGGGFIVTLGDKAADNLELYNRLLYKDEQGILPAKLMKKIEAPAEQHFYFSATDESFKLPPLDAFSEERFQLSLRLSRFHKFIDSIVSDKARTVLSFMPDDSAVAKEKRKPIDPAFINRPALVEWNPPLSRAQQPAAAKIDRRADRQPARYRGKVLLFTSTANVDWTSWPGSPSFLAMLNEITRVGVSGRLREQGTTVGGVLETYLPGNTEVDVKVHFPPGAGGAAGDAKSTTVKTILIDEVNLFRFGDTDFSGVYRVESGGTEIPFAVNVPGASAEQKGTESDLARLDETKLIELYSGWRLKVFRDPLEAVVTGGNAGDDVPEVQVREPYGPFLANVAFLLVLALLFIEIVLAWAFGHYTTAEGTVAPGGVSNFTSIAVAAVVAVLSTIFFVIGASILTHYHLTGDFLGFLPEIVRMFVEGVMNAPPPQAGEGRSWTYEPLSFLSDALSRRNEIWLQIAISLGAVAAIFFTYRAEAPKVSFLYKMLLGALRLYLILLTIWFLLPKPQLRFEREARPDMVLMIDTTRSMGEPDSYRDAATIDRAKKLGEEIRGKLVRDLPAKINALKEEVAAKTMLAEKNLELKAEADGIRQRLQYWEKQQDQLDKNQWKPSRLQLVQALLAQETPNWLNTLVHTHKSKLHVYVLDINGRAVKLHGKETDPGEIVDPTNVKQFAAAAEAIAHLEPVGNDSRLGTAVRQVIEQYNGAGLSSVIMFTDGVTTRDETLAQVSEYAGQKGISLFFIGVGDERQFRDLKLHDLNVEDPVYVGDRVVFDVSLTGKGYKDLVVPIVLKIKGKDGKEREVARELRKVDPNGKPEKIRLHDQPKEVGAKTYIIEVEPPKLEPNDKPLPQSNLRIERTIEVIDTKQIKVLYVEGQPRYEFRYIKFLMEREMLDAKKNKSIELKVLLLDADDEFHKTDDTALFTFPPTLKDLNQYDVLILGDCDPKHKKLQNSLKDIRAFVLGEDEKAKKGAKSGGGILFMAGALNNPHRYKGTPLADVMPVEPLNDVPPPEVPRINDKLRLELTPLGQTHAIFRFSPDHAENAATLQRLTAMHWHSTGYKIKPLAEVLAVHPTENALAPWPTQDKHHPLVVKAPAGTGRSMFFGFDETWRWRLREDEAKFNNFWIQTVRYLSRGQSTKTKLWLDRQTPYRTGEQIKIFITFPDSAPAGQKGPKLTDKTEVKVGVAYTPTEGKDKESGNLEVSLAKVPGSLGTYEGTWPRTRDGKYRFRLTHPDVKAGQPDGEQPSAEAIVELPPGELDQLRMNYQEMEQAADATYGKFFRLSEADRALIEIPPPTGERIVSGAPPELLWNQWWVFALVIFLITSEWILRKFKHLL